MAASTSYNSIIRRGSNQLPQALWYDVSLPEEGFILLDTFVLGDLQTGSNTTHLRLLVISGHMRENWSELQEFHTQNYQNILSTIPEPPENASIIAHLACSTDSQLEYGYTILRDVAEKIAKHKKWVVSDISLRKPSYRESENLDTPFLKMLQNTYSREELGKRPLTFVEKETTNRLKVKSYFTTPYSAVILVGALLLSILISTTFYKTLTLPGTFVLNLVMIIVLYIAYLKENVLLLDKEGIEYHKNNLYFFFIRSSVSKEFMPWPEIEEIQVMNSHKGGPDQEQFVIIGDETIIGMSTNHAQWMWLRIMIWICENKETLEPYLGTVNTTADSAEDAQDMDVQRRTKFE